MREAEQLQLGGFVRNLADGSVEVVSQGPDAALDALERRLRRGPSHAHVEAVERLQVSVELDVPRSFEIR